uniref:Casein kinase I n=1 Tax=Lygus hesperus TaxID=30085 RepID=A0A0A9XVS2_LYGHE
MARVATVADQAYFSVQDLTANLPPHEDHIVGGRYKMGRKIGGGSFGNIYIGVSIHTNEEVAIKREPISSKHPQIAYEAKLYKHFNGRSKPNPGVPCVRWFGRD